ncbi:MAG: cell division protein ZapA [Bacteroidetes bacterium]|nr:cell division protein ZapA [Bacteroidota bacterium]
MDDKMININVIVADRPYRLKVNAQEEGMVRAAAKQINKKVKEFQQAFSSKDKQDFLAMITLQNAVEGIKKGGAAASDNSPLNDKIEDLDQLLTKFLAR